jgi:F-type H+-transporting ATPase subunit gamma
MSQLATVRTRIRAIQTIKKVTHAMRLISMSSHTTLRRQEAQMGLYANTISDLFTRTQRMFPGWKNKYIASNEQQRRVLVIAIGSQKGLCGTFNTQVVQSGRKLIQESVSHQKLEFALVGKELIREFRFLSTGSIIMKEEAITARRIESLTESLATLILGAAIPYHEIKLIFNRFHSFFVQEVQQSSLFARDTQDELSKHEWHAQGERFVMDQSPTEVLDLLAMLHIRSQIRFCLFHSLLSEHAARFASMDGATRNAQTLLEQSKMMFNKLRQAKITTELAELSANFTV